jgi:hypothetical protein
MKRVIGFAAVGLLIATGAAFSQNTERSQPGTSTTSPNTTQSQSTPTQPQSAPTTERRGGSARESTGQRTEGTTTQTNTDRRSGSVNVRGGDREAFRERGSRSSVNVRMRMGDEGYRYRRHHGFGMYASGCRTIIVKSWHHGHRVIKRIRRCG